MQNVYGICSSVFFKSSLTRVSWGVCQTYRQMWTSLEYLPLGSAFAIWPNGASKIFTTEGMHFSWPSNFISARNKGNGHMAPMIRQSLAFFLMENRPAPFPWTKLRALIRFQRDSVRCTPPFVSIQRLLQWHGD